MPLPGFLSPKSSSIDANIPLGFMSFASASKTLDITVEKQVKSNWCWAAVGVSVAKYYQQTYNRTQCQLAGITLGNINCCGDFQSTESCNKPYYLDRTLKVNSNLLELISSNIPFSAIQTNIKSELPIGCRVGWTGGGGHFMVIKGWLVGAQGKQYITIADPIYAETQIAVTSFASGYQSGGSWTHTYLTCPSDMGAGSPGEQVDDPNMLGA